MTQVTSTQSGSEPASLESTVAALEARLARLQAAAQSAASERDGEVPTDDAASSAWSATRDGAREVASQLDLPSSCSYSGGRDGDDDLERKVTLLAARLDRAAPLASPFAIVRDNTGDTDGSRLARNIEELQARRERTLSHAPLANRGFCGHPQPAAASAVPANDVHSLTAALIAFQERLALERGPAVIDDPMYVPRMPEMWLHPAVEEFLAQDVAGAEYRLKTAVCMRLGELHDTLQDDPVHAAAMVAAESEPGTALLLARYVRQWLSSH